MNKVLADFTDRVKVKDLHERQHQWLVNQRNASWVIYALCLKLQITMWK